MKARHVENVYVINGFWGNVGVWKFARRNHVLVPTGSSSFNPKGFRFHSPTGSDIVGNMLTAFAKGLRHSIL